VLLLIGNLLKKGYMRLSRNFAQGLMADRMHGEGVTHVQGRLLLCVRVLWLALVLVTEGIFFSNLPAYFTLLQTICRAVPASKALHSTQYRSTLLPP
jgi:hypothetical protein